MALPEVPAAVAAPAIADGLSVVVAGPPALAAKLASGLTELGAAVALLGDEPDGLGRAAESLGRLDALIYAPAADELAGASFVETDEQRWVRVAEEPIWEALALFQAAYARFGADRGAIVAAVPSIALTGAAGMVAFSAAAEGIRQVVKSAARAWGAHGTRVNCLSLPIEEWELRPASAVPNRYGPSLPGGNSAADLAGAAATLIVPAAAAINGATVGVDRGTVLAP